MHTRNKFTTDTQILLMYPQHMTSPLFLYGTSSKYQVPTVTERILLKPETLFVLTTTFFVISF